MCSLSGYSCTEAKKWEAYRLSGEVRFISAVLVRELKLTGRERCAIAVMHRFYIDLNRWIGIFAPDQSRH